MKWDIITQTTLNNKHYSFAALTGKASGISVIDIDNMDTYNQLLVKYPILNDVFKVRTNKGIHLYFNYYEPLKTSSNVMKNYPNVDIRNDKALIIIPPTKYILLNGSIAEYTYINGELMDIPKEFLQEFKQFQEEDTNQTIIKNNTEEPAEIETSKYIYEIDEKQLKTILNNLDVKYLDGYNEWIKILRVIKFLRTTSNIDKYKIIDEWSIKNQLKYDKNNNLIEYNKLKFKASKYDINGFIREINKGKNKKDKLPKINFYIPLELDKLIIPNNYEKIEFENKFLYDGYTYEFFNKYDTQLISSDTGTGKTYSIGKHFKQYKEQHPNKKLLSIVSLISIADQQIVSFEKDGIIIHSYQTTPQKELMKNNLVICLNSLTKIKNITSQELKNYVVYIDEINLFLYTLTHNDNLNNNIKEGYEILIFIIKNAHKVIFTDAFITEQAFILASTRKQENKLFIKNTYQKFMLYILRMKIGFLISY